MGDFLQDARYTVRTLLKNPGFTIVAVLALALGIGANSAIFSVVHGVLLKPLPFKDSDRLVGIWEKAPTMEMSIAYPDVEDWRQRSKSFESLTAFRRDNMNLTGIGEPERLQVRMVSWEFFRTFGASIPVGRDFSKADDTESAAPTTILTYGLWQRRFGGDRNILGQQITLNQRKYTVIGVTPKEFRYGQGIELFTPLALGLQEMWKSRGNHPGIYAVGRLKPGVSIDQARSELTAINKAIALEHPKETDLNGAHVEPVLQILVGDARQPILIVFAAVGFIVLIACANVANLLLARATAREREMAIRNAMGASRGRIIRQLLTESVLLSSVGGALGVLLALWGVRLLHAAKPSSLPRLEDVSINTTVLLFTAGTAIATGLLFGLVPALYSSRGNVGDLLKDAAVRGASRTHNRLRSVLMVSEFALAVVLLIGAGLTIKSLRQLTRVDPGFAPEKSLTFSLTVSPEKYKGTSGLQMLEQLRQDLGHLPGVRAASFADGAPLLGASETSFVRQEESVMDNNALKMSVEYAVTPQFMDAMGLRLIKGRFIGEQDRAETQRVLVVDDRFAKNVFPGKDAVGQHVKRGDQKETFEYEIIGVVGHVKNYGLDTEGPVENEFYEAMHQVPDKYVPQAIRRVLFVLRTDGDPASLSGAVRSTVANVDPDLPIFDVATYSEVLRDNTEVQRFTTVLLGAFAGLALVLAAIGIYGVIGYSVAKRTHEIGIRMALGAHRSDVLAMVMRQAATVIGIGVVAGLVAALALTRFMSHVLFNVKAYDPSVFVSIAVTLVAIALIASYIPARRATRVDPMVALRNE